MKELLKNTKSIELMKSGKLRMGEVKGLGIDVDITKEHIDMLEAHNIQYQQALAILAKSDKS